jgi:two-component system, NtrC family, response regulator
LSNILHQMEKSKILIIDDEEQLRTLVKRIVALEGFTVIEAPNLHDARKLLERGDIDVILCDVKLPDGSGVNFVKEIRPKFPLLEIILLTAYGNIKDGVQAMKNGAFDYIMKGDDNDKLIPLIYKAVEKVQLQKRIEELQQQVDKRYSFDNIIGNSIKIKEAISLAKKVAQTDTTVLLTGETGTGKEVFAQAIHNSSKRSLKSFLALNCSAFSKELLESEIFGHKAGAFTGATKDKKGLIEEANNGTLFLDEIGEMHIDLQSKLLRVLETNEFIKVGDTKPTNVNVRIIAATNRDLTEEIKEGKFREDLFYRLNVFAIRLPSLRERNEDIPLLANHFLKLFAERTNKRITGMDAVFVKRLQQQDWKGNIRELKNTIERAVILAEGSELKKEQLSPYLLQASLENEASFDLADVEKLHIQKVLHYTKGNKTKTAELLGIGLTTLYRKLEEYKIDSDG